MFPIARLAAARGRPVPVSLRGTAAQPREANGKVRHECMHELAGRWSLIGRARDLLRAGCCSFGRVRQGARGRLRGELEDERDLFATPLAVGDASMRARDLADDV
jgi:hypothetical protein